MSDRIFVFGSNLGGIHGAGAARTALEDYGAKWGLGVGPHGHSYAIPTKDGNYNQRRVGDTLPESIITEYVNQFIAFATTNPDLKFQVTRIGCGLAGLKDKNIAPLFRKAPPNCSFGTVWEPILGQAYHYWGTF